MWKVPREVWELQQAGLDLQTGAKSLISEACCWVLGCHQEGGIWALWTGDPIAGRKRTEREGEWRCVCLVARAFHVLRKGAPKAGHRAATSLWAAAGPGKNPQLWARASALG